MITPAFSLTATERVLPSMALDFTTASLDSRITFTRALATATRVNASGLIEAIAADTARFDYDPVTLACKGLLIEEARTNILFPSNDFSGWSVLNTSISTVSATAPDGSSTVTKVIPNNGATIGVGASGTIVSKTSVVTNTTAYALTLYAKADEFNQLGLFFSDGVAGIAASFNLSNGTVVSGTGASIAPAGNGWYRCAIQRTTAGTGSVNGYRISALDSTATTGDGTSGVLIFGIQHEAGAFATSYIPTTTAAVTRNADVATMTGTNFSDWYNATEGSFYVKGNRLEITSFAPFVAVNDETTANEMYVANQGSTARAFTRKTAGVSGDMTATGAWTVNTVGSALFGYKANDLALSFSGNTVATDATADIPTVNRLHVGTRAAGNYPLNGHVQKILYWPYRLSSSQVQAFSK